MSDCGCDPCGYGYSRGLFGGCGNDWWIIILIIIAILLLCPGIFGGNDKCGCDKCCCD